MLCNICAKAQATVHLTEIIDDKMTELHLCEECAQKKGAQMESHFGLADLLAGLADLGGQFNATTKETKIKCMRCGLTYEDFKKVGRLGCGECYTAFKEALLPLLKRIHGSTQHYGKSPKKLVKSLKSTKVLKAAKESKGGAQELKDRLQQAIQKEEFEEAAKLRDMIREMEKKDKK
ncbi:MAG: UvrB/UvrC motif-containing protein [Candidatus Omnitrophica bacterium]|nr:UvrB/UvrC motif-containing protein [Candidatus Omnitrophota bacterium]MBU4149096.1 UvrB/UvrC motif-containing protein [Candidatus Omnitrophota bacterium]